MPAPARELVDYRRSAGRTVISVATRKDDRISTIKSSIHMARARSVPTRETIHSDEDEEVAEAIPAETQDPEREPDGAGADTREPAPGPAAELVIPTTPAALVEAIAQVGPNTKFIEPAGYVIAEEIKAWVRREMTLAACGVDEEERKKQNP